MGGGSEKCPLQLFAQYSLKSNNSDLNKHEIPISLFDRNMHEILISIFDGNIREKIAKIFAVGIII